MENQPLPKILKSQRLVRFHDCDPFRHLNNAAYINYFMDAREDQVLSAYNFNIYALGKSHGIGWVVSQNQIAYLRPANLLEVVTITSKLIDFGKRSMVVEFAMLSEDEQELKAMMWTTLIHYDIRTGKSIEHEAELMEKFTEVVVEREPQSFEERIRDVRAMAKKKVS